MANLTNLRTRARQIADQELRPGQDEANHIITDTIATQFVNDAIKEVYGLLTRTNPDEYTEPGDPFTTSTNVFEYDLPADFGALRGVERQIDAANDKWVDVPKANWGERNKTGLRYRRRKDKLRFTLDPQSDVYRVWHIPKATALVDGTDEYGGSEESEELVVVKAAKKMKIKTEDDIQELLIEEQRLTSDLIDANTSEDMQEPDTITDVYSDFDDQWPGRTARGFD